MRSLRPINIEYADECLAILNELFDLPWTEINSVFKSDTSLVLGAFSNNTLVGFCAASTVLDEGEVLMCAVHPTFQRQGVGSLLVSRMIEDCRRRNVVNFFLEVDVSNVAAQKLYEKHGFQVVGKRKAYYQKLDGTFNDALIMRCGDL